MDRGALTAGGDQPGLAQDLEVLAGVGHRQADLTGQGLHGAFAVGEHVQQLDPPAAGQRLGRPGELSNNAVLAPRSAIQLPKQFIQVIY